MEGILVADLDQGLNCVSDCGAKYLIDRVQWKENTAMMFYLYYPYKIADLHYPTIWNG